MVIHTHGFFSCNDNILARIKYAYKYAGAVVSLSHADAAYWGTICKRSYVTTNPIPINDEGKRPHTLKNQEIVWVGRVSREKRPTAAVEIFAQVHKELPDARLTIVGTGPDDMVDALSARAAELGVADFIEIAGYQTDVKPYYKRASVYLHTSMYEGFTLAIAESMMFGLPAVVFELPNVDYIRTSSAIFKAKQNDYEAAAQEIIRLLSDEDYYEQQSIQTRDEYEEIIALDPYRVWGQVFNDLCTNSSHAAPLNEETLQVIVDSMFLIQSELKQEAVLDAVEDTKQKAYNSSRYRIGNALLFLPHLAANFFKLIGRYTLVDMLYILKEQFLGRRDLSEL